jgi:hypothetical protein
MTSNLTRFIMDGIEVALGRDRAAVAQVRRRAARTWPAIVGFAADAALGAACFATAGCRSAWRCWPFLSPGPAADRRQPAGKPA